jgi:hypothetical protein
MARDGRKRGESRNESLLAWWARRAGNVGVEDEGLGQALGSRWRASLLTEPLPGRAPDRRALRARRSALLRAYLACIPYSGMYFRVECSAVIANKVSGGKAAICLWDAIMNLGAGAPLVDKPSWSWVDSWHGKLWVRGGACRCGDGCKVGARGSGNQCEVGVVTFADVLADAGIRGRWEYGEWGFTGRSTPEDRNDLSQRSIEVDLPLGNHGGMASGGDEFL